MKRSGVVFLAVLAMFSALLVSSASPAQAAASECGVPTATYRAGSPVPERVGDQLKAFGTLNCTKGTGYVSFETSLKWQSPLDKKFYTIGIHPASAGNTSPNGLVSFFAEGTYNCHGDTPSGFLAKTYYSRDGVLISDISHRMVVIRCHVYPPPGTPGY